MTSWIKTNWLIVLFVVIGVLTAKQYLAGRVGVSTGENMVNDSYRMAAPSTKMMFGSPAAPSESTDRLVIQNTGLSLQVNDVGAVIKSIESLTKDFGGFLVNSNLRKPDSSATGHISVRVPEDKRANAMDAYKKLAVKVVSESVSGTDVTDSYVDLQAQLDVLVKTKLKYEEILNQATRVSDLLEVQQQLTNIQQQIDNVKGQQKYYEQSAKLTLISIDLATDELALPYAPTNEWRPAVVFKTAVRSLVGSFRSIGSLIIWGVVYTPFIVLILVAVWLYKKWQKRL